MPPISHDYVHVQRQQNKKIHTTANYHHHQITTLTMSGILLLLFMTGQLLPSGHIGSRAYGKIVTAMASKEKWVISDRVWKN